MCVNLPAKIVSADNKGIVAEINGQRKQVSDLLVKAKQGDYVFLKDKFIIGKINEKEAEKIINLVKNNI
jgi:hydrogenase maturation factor